LHGCDKWDCTGVDVEISEARDFVEIGPYGFNKNQAIALAFVILHLADKLEG
jgi:hypothetical protein